MKTWIKYAVCSVTEEFLDNSWRELEYHPRDQSLMFTHVYDIKTYSNITLYEKNL